MHERRQPRPIARGGGGSRCPTTQGAGGRGGRYHFYRRGGDGGDLCGGSFRRLPASFALTQARGGGGARRHEPRGWRGPAVMAAGAPRDGGTRGRNKRWGHGAGSVGLFSRSPLVDTVRNCVAAFRWAGGASAIGNIPYLLNWCGFVLCE